MKRKNFLVTCICTLLASLTLCVFGACAQVDNERIFIELSAEEPYIYDDSTKTFTVEYGNSFALPEGLVYDKNGQVLDQYFADYYLYNEDGEEIVITTNYLTLSIGNYSLVYSAKDYGSSAKDLNFNIVVEDPKAPSLEVTSFFVNAGVVGDTIYLPTFRLSDTSGVDQSATKVSVKYNGNDVQIANNSFVAENAGTYTYELYTKDAVGNETTYQIPVEITEPYVDSAITGQTLMSFDNADYSTSVKTLYGTSDTATVAISSDAPEGTADITPDGGVAITSPENGHFNVLFVNNKTVNVYEDSVGSIIVRLYTDELIEELVVYSGDGRTEYVAFSYVMPGWHELEINGRGNIGWYSDFSDFAIEAYNEDKVNVFIDEIYYTIQWKDEAIEENILADFDEEGYLGIVKPNYMNITPKFSIISKDTQDLDETDAAAVEGANGGILKVVQSANLDGALIPFAVPVDSTTFTTIRVRMYFVPSYDADGKFTSANFPKNSRSGIVTNDGFTSSAWWGDYFSGSQGNMEPGWKDYYYNAITLRNSIKAADSNLIVSFYYSPYDLDLTHTFYIDEIEVYYGDQTVAMDIPGQFDHTDGKVGTLADFTIPEYVSNVTVAPYRGNFSTPSVVLGGYEYAEYKVGEEDKAGLKITRSGKNALGSSWPGFEGWSYVLPQNVSLRNTDKSPKAGEIIIRAWFPAMEENLTVVWGVVTPQGTTGVYPESAVPARVKTVKAGESGYYDFVIDVKSLLNEGMLELSAIYLLTRGGVSEENAALNSYYVESITFTEYIPPYQDADFMQKYGETDELVLADFDEEGYSVSLTTSSFGTGTATYSLETVTIEDTEYGVVKFIPATTNNVFSGIDVMFADEVDLKPGKTPMANYIYVRMYTPVALDSAYVNFGVIKTNGTYSTDGRFTVPQRIVKSLAEGWNVLKIDVAQLGDEGVTSILGMAITVRPTYPTGTADADKYVLIDAITIDENYDAAKRPVILAQSKITATKNGSSVVLSWTEDQNAGEVVAALNGTPVTVANDGTYTIANFDASTSYRFTVTQSLDGAQSTIGAWYYSANAGTRIGNEFVLADFTEQGYTDTLYQAEYEPQNKKLVYSIFGYENGKAFVDTSGQNNSSPQVRSGFTYYFPFAMDNLKQLKLSANNVKDLSSNNNVWGIGHYADTYLGVIDENGNCYDVANYTLVAGKTGTQYISYYNSITPIYTIDIETLRSDLAAAEEPVTLGKIVALVWHHAKEARIELNYIRYVDCDFLSDPKLTWKKDGSNYVVSWNAVEGAETYTLTVGGEVVNAAYTQTSYTLTQNGVTVGVKANGGEGYYESSTVTTYIDPSYMTARDTTYTWLSNFDNEGTLALWQPYALHYGQLEASPWGTSDLANLSWQAAASSGYLVNGKYNFAGVQFAGGAGNAMASAKYNLPETFDLATASEIYFVVECSSWGTGPIAVEWIFASGDKFFNPMTYAEWGSGLNPTTYEAVNASYIGKNYKRLNIRLQITEDVLEAVEAAFGSTKIDSMVFGRYLQSYTYTVDEIYFAPKAQ